MGYLQNPRIYDISSEELDVYRGRVINMRYILEEIIDFLDNFIFSKINKLIIWLRPFSFINIVFYIFCSLSFIFFVFFLTRLIINSEGDHYVSFVALLAAIATLTTLIYNLRRHISEDYFKDSKEYLKRAYENFEPRNGNDAPPNDRMTWLNTARLLGIADRLGDKILMDSHRESFLEEKEFLKSKFRAIVKDFAISYYCDGVGKFKIYGKYEREPIAESSIFAIHKFISWTDDYTDPLQKVKFSSDDINKLYRKYPTLSYLLSEARKVK